MSPAALGPRPAIGGLWFGGDYNPEQWDEAVWAEDGRLMRAAGVNTATVGVFSWALLEPEEGRYDFGWLDATLDRLHRSGVQVILATPTASPPPWFTLAHPDAMPVTRDGVRLTHGSRDTYCAAAPAYRTAARRIAAALAARYAGHPALALWHVHNEYGTVCWCEHAATAFRNWLQRRYGPAEAGLRALNEAWGTAFWGQRYTAWEQVLPPRATQWLGNPSQLLDFRRFWSDELLAAFCEQRDAIRQHAPGTPVTTNFILPDYQVVDPWAWSREVDVVAVDHYLSGTGPDGHADIAFAADRARSWAAGRPWLLMEQATRLVYDGGRILSRAPGRMLTDTLGYLARGSDSVLFFQWRASRAGAEMYHSAMVPHAGPDSAAFREVVALGGAVRRLSEVAGSTVAAPAAVLLDADSWWALEARGLRGADISYLDEVRRAHAALWRAGTGCDFARPEGDLSGYRLVLAPALYLLTDQAAASLRDYVTGGGQLVVTFGSGIVDPAHQVRLGGYPGALRDLLGIRVEEFFPLPAAEPVPLSTGEAGTAWSELLQSTGAEVLARYAAGPLAGQPAITRNRAGTGSAWYLSTRLEDTALDRVIGEAAAAAELAPVLPGLRPGVEAARRRGAAGQSWLFVLNHTAQPAVIAVCGRELLSGAVVAGRLEVAPGGVAVVREEPG
ncbi:MAG: beta-galactosidase [Streptosporangiales bacterium]